VAEMGDRDHLVTIDVGRKEAAAVPFSEGGGVNWAYLTQCGLGRDLCPYQVAS